jgi:signal recognition particle receptor subunit beta
MPEEHKILFTGTMGSGKTTAISAVSAIRTVNTEASNTEKGLLAKATTTVGFDYGEVDVGDGSVLRLYGTPGQKRFEFMWRIIARGAMGLVVLVDNSRPDPIEDLSEYLDNFRSIVKTGSAVIGVGRTQSHARPSLEDYYSYLGHKDLLLPVFEVDVRKTEDVLMLLDVLFNMLELAEV